MSGVKYSSKTSSGDLGIGTVGPTEDVKGCIVGVTTLEAMYVWKRQWMGLEAIGEAEAVAMGEWMQLEAIGEAEAVAMGEWMQEVVDWICG